MTYAETEYLFRHAVMRDVAYGLHLPTDRATLHALSLQVLEANGADPAELARHAREAQADPAREPAMQQRELEFLRRAAGRAMQDWRPAEAIAHARRALELPCAGENDRIGAQCMLVTASITLGRHDVAQQEVVKALKLCRAQKDQDGLLPMLFNAGLICHFLGDDRAAREYNAELLVLTRHTPNSPHHARALKQRGVLSKRMGDLEESRACFDQSLDIVRAIGDRREIAGVLIDRGLYFFDTGDLPRAQRDYEEALELLAGERDPMRVSILKYNVGRLHHARGDYAGALHAANEAAEVARAAAHSANVANALHQAGLALRALGRETEAAAALRESADLFIETGQTPKEAD